MPSVYSFAEVKQLIKQLKELKSQLRNGIDLSGKYHSQLTSITGALIRNDTFMHYARDNLLENTDKPEKEITEFLEKTYRYIVLKPLSEECKKIYRDNSASIDNAIDEASPAANPLKWLFTSGKKKKSAENACAILNDKLNGEYAESIRTLTEKIRSADTDVTPDVWEDLRSDRAKYNEILSPLNPADSGSRIPEISALLEHYSSLSHRFSVIRGSLESLTEAIKSAADRLAAVETMKTLRSIQIEELNREKRGFRISLLRDAGYQTVADIYAANVYNLSSINGISDDAAHALKRAASEIASQTRNEIKIRLSADDRSAEATALISAVFEYKQNSGIVKKIDELVNGEGTMVSGAIRDVSWIGNGFLWLTASDDERENARNAYKYLDRQYTGSYTKTAEELTSSMNQTQVCDDDAWNDFSSDTVSYFNILESLVPGLLGNGDALYGLPEELAREIQEECFFPDGLKCELRRYQEFGVRYILHQKRVLLGDEMGLGKTIQAIAVMVSLCNVGARHFIVICPASVLPNWCKEISSKSKLRVTKVHGGDRDEALDSWKKNGGVAVTTYETVGRLNFEENFRFDLLVVDEAHYIKNQNAARSKNVRDLCVHTDRILFMTGTALENHVNEMISLVGVLQPEIAKQAESIAFMSSAPQFRERIAPVYYRRKRDDVLTELPELIESMEWCSLSTPAEREAYRESLMRRNYMEIRRLSWQVNDLRQSSKAKRLLEIVEEAKSDGRKVLVFSFFLETIRKIRAFLGDRCVDPINGSVSPQRRQEIIDEFDKSPTGAVLCAQIQSGGTGLNIQSASVVVICEPQFKPSIENQAISRAYRMGQARNVLVYRLLCEDTIDEHITGILERKQNEFDAFADKSAAAEKVETPEVDEKTFGKIVEEEIERMKAAG